jgi:hypothetical protein
MKINENNNKKKKKNDNNYLAFTQEGTTKALCTKCVDLAWHSKQFATCVQHDTIGAGGQASLINPIMPYPVWSTSEINDISRPSDTDEEVHVTKVKFRAMVGVGVEGHNVAA